MGGSETECVVPHIRREIHLARIAGHHVTLEDLLLVQPKPVLCSKDENLVVHGLAGQPLACSPNITVSQSAKIL